MTENNVSNRIAFVEKFLAAAAEKLGTTFTPADGSDEFRLATAQEFIRKQAARYGVKVAEIDVQNAADTIEQFLAANAKDAGAPYTTFAQSLEAEAAEEAKKAAKTAEGDRPEVEGGALAELKAAVGELKTVVQKMADFAKGYGFRG